MNKDTKIRISPSFLMGIVLLVITGFTNVIVAQKFVIPVFPDSQSEISGKLEMFTSQFNWIVQQKEALNIPIVLHVGDIVNFDNIGHWENAGKGFDLLDHAGIPYAVTLGNHDTEAVGENSGSAAPGNTRLNLRKTTKFNTYFPTSRFTSQTGRYEAGKSDNAFYTFNAGGLKWMVLSLEFCARQGPVDWANSVVAANPTCNVIVLTHYHLDPNGTISTSNAGYGDLSPSNIYNQFVKKHANILLVLSGHLMSSNWRSDVGDSGNKIYQILQDYQDADFGGGYLRLLEIDTNMKTISAKMYSPYYNLTKQDGSMFQFTGVKFVENTTINPVVTADTQKISVYPNPVKENQTCTIKISGMTDQQLEGARMSIYNIQGVRIFYSTNVSKLNVLNISTKDNLFMGYITTESGENYTFKVVSLNS